MVSVKATLFLSAVLAAGTLFYFYRTPNSSPRDDDGDEATNSDSECELQQGVDSDGASSELYCDSECDGATVDFSTATVTNINLCEAEISFHRLGICSAETCWLCRCN